MCGCSIWLQSVPAPKYPCILLGLNNYRCKELANSSANGWWLELWERITMKVSCINQISGSRALNMQRFLTTTPYQNICIKWDGLSIIFILITVLSFWQTHNEYINFDLWLLLITAHNQTRWHTDNNMNTRTEPIENAISHAHSGPHSCAGILSVWTNLPSSF